MAADKPRAEFGRVQPLTGSTLSNNTAGLWGGGIAGFGYDEVTDTVRGSVEVVNSTISNNSADFGGGIISDQVITITRSTISNNFARGAGGGVYSYGYGEYVNRYNQPFGGDYVEVVRSDCD